ncbi:MAG: translation elongation factor EF-1 subunit alpha [Candidatus Burarchaeum sp.]|nr:translation elongation factor EF-1 subunit alpha [Candidatus Burarchaeum sp.]MDO8339653.1 translation elongation factor EF-1 subunit alpha [Candidatus Burarchaeum sp.]
MAAKEHLNMIFIGHVDHGKSTTVGRILYDTGALSEQELRKLKEEAESLGKATFEFAFTMDTLKEERERGVTIDISHKDFQTAKYYFTIIDAPGHKDFVKNMITGASQADAAVLVCSVKEGIQPQTKEHAFLAKVLGIQQLIIAVNKMDAVNYDRVKYEDLKAQLTTVLKNVGFKMDTVPFVPISAYDGVNIAKKSDKTPWYTGPTLVEAFDTFTVPKKPTDKPLRLPIQDVFTITGHGTVPVGRVETGILKVGDSVVFMPSGAKGEVKSIEMHHQQLTQAVPGDNVGFNVKGVDKKDVRRGEVVGTTANPPTVVQEFTAQIVVLDHPTAIPKGSYTPVFHIHTAQIACTIIDILEKKDPKTGGTLQKSPDFIKTGDVAIVKVKPTRPIVIEKFSEFPQLGRFAIRDMGQTVAAGIVLDVVKKAA